MEILHTICFFAKSQCFQNGFEFLEPFLKRGMLGSQRNCNTPFLHGKQVITGTAPARIMGKVENNTRDAVEIQMLYGVNLGMKSEFPLMELFDCKPELLVGLLQQDASGQRKRLNCNIVHI